MNTQEAPTMHPKIAAALATAALPRLTRDYIREAVASAETNGRRAALAVGVGNTLAAQTHAEAAASYANSALAMIEEA